MKIETNDYVTVAQACEAAGIPVRTGYRLAESLGIMDEAFGVKIIKKSDLERFKTNRRRVGNPRWIASYEEASEAALQAVKSRMKKARAAKRGQSSSA